MQLFCSEGVIYLTQTHTGWLLRTSFLHENWWQLLLKQFQACANPNSSRIKHMWRHLGFFSLSLCIKCGRPGPIVWSIGGIYPPFPVSPSTSSCSYFLSLASSPLAPLVWSLPSIPSPTAGPAPPFSDGWRPVNINNLI